LETNFGVRHFVDMPRYLFNVFNDDITLDEEGQDFPDADAARACAIETARDLACESIQAGRLNLNHRIEVTTEDKERVFSLEFREAFQVMG
jgi:hypothetical protein